MLAERPPSDASGGNIEPGPEVVTAHLRGPQVHVARAAPRDVPEGRIQFKLPLFFT